MKKIIDAAYTDNCNEIAMSKCSIEYCQELDCCQSTTEYPMDTQTITLTTDDGGGGKFIRFHTGAAGWSIDNIEELILIFNDFNQRIKCE